MIEKLTESQRNAFFNDPTCCPFCRAEDPEELFCDAMPSVIEQLWQYADCEQTWTQVYTLTDLT